MCGARNGPETDLVIIMMKVLIVISLGVLCASASKPSCCLDDKHFADLLSAFSCSFTCGSEEIIPYNCISCMTSMPYANSAFENLNFMKPAITCQDFFYEAGTVSSHIMLSWFVSPSRSKFVISLYVVEVRSSAMEGWNFVGMTNLTVATVSNLGLGVGYQFRVTPIAMPNITLPSVSSDWIFITDSKDIMEYVNLTAVNFKFENNYVQATVQWIISRDAPCSFNLRWYPADNKFEGQKTVTVPSGTSSMVLFGLYFQTNYTVKLGPVKQTQMEKPKYAQMWFVTPSCLSLTGGNFSLCAPGPPLNLSVSWIDKTQALVSWLPPHHTSMRNKVFSYHLSVIEASEKYHTALQYKKSFIFNEDILSAVVSDLKPSVLYIVEIQASSIGGTGPSVSVELNIKEPRSIAQQLSYVPWHYVLPSSILAVSAILVALCLNFYRMHKRSKHVPYPSGTADVPSNSLPYLLQSKKIDLHEVIGKGEFGVVHKAVYSRNKNKEVVAVKIFPAESMARSKVLHEVEMLLKIGRHRNVVGLIGFTMDVDKVSLLLEYCAMGNLHTRIQKLKGELLAIKKQLSDPKQSLLENTDGKYEHYGIKVSSYIYQVAVGMEYISSLNLIHRDLAARNILLCSENHVKIADFGLAKDVSDTHSYTVLKQKKLPIRWMAPESLEKQIFTTKTDVWSFGVLMWEIFKFGKNPYSSLSNSSILEYLRKGYRLPKPSATTQYWYDLMLECWHFKPLKRPTFTELVTKTSSILNTLGQYCIVVSD